MKTRIPIIEAFKLTYGMAKGREKVTSWFLDAVDVGNVKVFVTDKLHGSQYCEIRTSFSSCKTVDANDYIMLDISGNIITCKHDDFSDYEVIEKVEEMSYSEAQMLLESGYFIALPEWQGFWFSDHNTNKVTVLTKDFTILTTPFEEFKLRNDWQIVEASEKQMKVLNKHYSK